MNPTAIYDLASTVLECVCDQMDALTETLAEDDVAYACPCLKFVSPGPPPLDHCCAECDGSGGMLAVHVEQVYQSEFTAAWPTPQAPVMPCKPASWVAQVVVSVSRCVPGPDEQGNPPDPADIDARSLIVYTDFFAVLQALSCCVATDALPGNRKRRVQIEAATTGATEGGCALVEVRALVEVGSLCGPCDDAS